MKIVFDIEGEVLKTDAVLCEWGKNYVCVAGLNQAAQSLHNLRYYTSDSTASAENIDTVSNYISSLQQNAAKLVFCSGFPEAVLIPKKIYKAEHNLLATLYDIETSPLADHIGEWQLVNNYVFPELVLKAVHQHFPSSIFYHAYTPALKTYNGFDETNQIAIHFTPSLFQVIVKKGGQLQLAQMYAYKTALDVVYYLLKMMEELGLSKEETAVIVSGLLEETSGLYMELRQFISKLYFAKSTAISLKTDQPSHYFSSLYNLAACVS